MGEAAALAAALLYSLNAVFLRWGSTKVDLLWLNALRSAIAAVVMLLVLLALRGPGGLFSLPLAAAFWLVLTTLVMVAVGDTLFYLSCQRIGVARSSPIANAYPLISVVLAIVWLGEAATWQLALGTPLVLLGAYLVAQPSGRRQLPGEPEETKARSSGLALAVAACFAWSLGAIFDRFAVQIPSVDLLAATSLRLLSGTVFLSALARTRPLKIRWATLPAGFWPKLLAVAIGCGLLTPLMWLFAVQQAGAARASLLSATGPLWGLLFAAIFLREPVSRTTIVGAVLTVIGVWQVI